MKTFFKILLFILIWSLIAAVLIGGSWVLLEAVMPGVYALIAAFLIYLLIKGIRRLIARYRAKQRVQHLVNVEQAEGGAPPKRDWLAFLRKTPLDKRIRAIVKLLRQSRLNEQGDPVYLLPWHILLGADSGKTAVVANSRAPAPTIDDPALRSQGDSVDWWLFNDMVVLDTPASFVADDSAPSEWGRLLDGLDKYRMRDPLNGIVVSVDVATLDSQDRDQLFELGRRYRRRVDEAMRSLHLCLPVYLLVSGADQLDGFQDWCRVLPREALDQPMGQARDDDGPAESFVRRAMADIADRMKRLMLVTLSQGKAPPGLIRLPSRLETLGEPLSAFADGLFQANAFEETPMFRGVYLSGRYAGDNGTDSLQAFSRDLVSSVIPADRSAYPTQNRAERLHWWFSRAVLTGWGMAITLAVGLLALSWWSSTGYLKDFPPEGENNIEVVEGDFGASVTNLYNRLRLIRRLDQETNGWSVNTARWVPWYGVPGFGTPHFIETSRNHFAIDVRDGVLTAVEAAFDEELSAFMADGGKGKLSDEQARTLASYYAQLNRRMAVLIQILSDEGLFDEEPFNSENLPPSLEAELPTVEVDGQLVSGIDWLNDIYIQSLLWTKNRQQLEDELERLRVKRRQLERLTGGKLSWLIPWANAELAESRIELESFWLGTGRFPQSASVPPAYTLLGQETIATFIDDLIAASDDPRGFQQQATQFWLDYRKNYLDAWEAFALNFESGNQALRGKEEWQLAVDTLATPRNPFFQALDVLADEIAGVQAVDQAITASANAAGMAVDIPAQPEWADLVVYYQQMRNYAPDDAVDTSKRNKVLTKLALGLAKKFKPLKGLAKATKKGLKQKKKLDKASPGAKGSGEREQQLERAGKLLGDYRAALVDVSFNSDSRTVSYQAAQNLFTNADNPSKGEGPDARAFEAVLQLENAIGKETRYNRAFWALYGGPLSLIEHYRIQETACYLQNEWENRFLVNIEGVPEYKLPGLIFGEGGQLWQFMQGPLNGFVDRRYGAGYVAVKARGNRIPVQDELLRFASRGRDGFQAAQSSYKVAIEALPTGTNRGAKFRPSKTTLRLQCPNETQMIENFNFPVSETFTWSEDCGNVTLSFDVGNQVVEKVYDGPKAFPRFLRDFGNGKQRIVARQFGDYALLLQDYGIEYIDVEFVFTDADPVIATLEQTPLNAPRRIAACWDT